MQLSAIHRALVPARHGLFHITELRSECFVDSGYRPRGTSGSGPKYPTADHEVQKEGAIHDTEFASISGH